MPPRRANNDSEALVEKTRAWLHTKWALDKAKDLEAPAKSVMLAQWDAEPERKTLELDVDGMTVRATIVRGSTVKVDPAKLKKAIGGPAYAKLCSLQFDPAKLEAALAMGEVAPTVVAACSDEISKAPYVKATISGASERKGP
jgi:hypothetical protein